MSEKASSLAVRIRNDELLLGTVISIHSSEVAEILSSLEFDWLFIDAEHSAFDPQDTLSLLQAAGTTPCLVRVPAGDEVWLKKALDVGAAGVIAPQVNTAAQAKQIIDLCKYPPQGKRGMGLSRASQFGLNLFDYIKTANNSTAVILQAEHKDAVENINDIVSIEGIDAILVGPFDLSASFNKPGQTSDPEIQSAIDTVTQACKQAGITLGTAVASIEDTRAFIKKGYKLVACGADSFHLITNAKNTLSRLRET